MVSSKPSMTVRPYEHKVSIVKNSTSDATYRKPHSTSSFLNDPVIYMKKFLRIIPNYIKNRSGIWLVGICVYLLLFLLIGEDSGELLTEEDHVSLREWVRENEDMMRAEYRHRSDLAHEVCSQYDVYVSPSEYQNKPGANRNLDYSDWHTLKRINWNYMYYVSSQDLVYCKVPKSGSSTWVYNLLKLAKAPIDLISSDVGLHKILRDFYPQISSTKMKRIFKRSYKFMVVRHPFDRILSAYRDKMEDYQRDLRFREGYYYTMYGKNIVKVYRDQNDLSLANRTEPTWPEFVKYLINTPASKFDEHWKPIFMLCSPCVMKYDLIAKIDTFSEDTQFIINQLGLEDRLQVEWIHRTGEAKTSEVARNYFSQLSSKMMDNLYAKYHLDFELFGYNYDDYREMAYR